MENVHDWNISRQLWWGQQIPAFYYGTGENDFVVAENIDDAVKLAQERTSNFQLQASDLKQDEDALDTWFSSWLWPMSVFEGILDPENKDINYYYPTSDLVTGPDIIFFWVARMIMAGHEYQHQKMGLKDDEKIQDIGGPEENMANILSGIFVKKFEKEFPKYSKILYDENK
jgi:valyl-tRNA synthetase